MRSFMPPLTMSFKWITPSKRLPSQTANGVPPFREMRSLISWKLLETSPPFSITNLLVAGLESDSKHHRRHIAIRLKQGAGAVKLPRDPSGVANLRRDVHGPKFQVKAAAYHQTPRISIVQLPYVMNAEMA